MPRKAATAAPSKLPPPALPRKRAHNPGSHDHLKKQYTQAEIDKVCEIIRDGNSEKAALKRCRIRWVTWRARRRENKEMDDAVQTAENDLLSHLMSMGAVEDELRKITGKAIDAKAKVAKVKIWARMAMAEKIRPDLYKPQTKIEHTGRIAGMEQLLNEIDGSETGVGRS
jgi:N-glycosylase/DNA lyase